ncbi:MAG: glycosyltransferase family 4 protein [Nitrospinae bacterium]|nr:glycosyltransferase family 4 protein [Nitrospinota bacterium]
MNIFLDARFYKRSGIGRYIEGLYRGVIDYKPEIKIIAAGNGQLLSEGLFRRQMVFPFDAPVYSLSEQIEGSLLVRKFGRMANVFHFPHYNAPWFLPENSVVTVHDLTQFLFPEFFGRLRRCLAPLVLRNTLKKAGRIITVSESTAKDITDYYPEIVDKIRVIHNGISYDFKPLPEDKVIAFKKDKGVEGYIMYVGNRKPHKNIKRLIEAFSKIRIQHHNLKLIIVGEKFSDIDEVDEWIDRLDLRDDIIEIERVSQEELRGYYCGAIALVHPSLYEGFGFPPLEAMACGIPVIVSNTSSLPEVCGDAAIYFDPYNVSDMVEKINLVLENDGLRITLVEKGFNRVRSFSWQRSAEETINVFKEISI